MQPSEGGVANVESAGSGGRSDSQVRRSTTAARLRWLLVVGLLAANLLLLAMGLLAAGVGGGLTDWGSGAGGLGGWTDGLMTIFSVAVGFAAGVATFKEGRSIPVALTVMVTGLLIGVGYLIVAHLVDPCVNGWWDANSQIGSQPLCERFGSELNSHTRFHLLLHAIVGVLSAWVAALIYRWRKLFAWWPPEGPDTAR